MITGKSVTWTRATGPGPVNRARDLAADEAVVDFFLARPPTGQIFDAAEPLVSLRASTGQ